MITFALRTEEAIVRGKLPSASNSGTADHWSQPPATYYTFEVIDGHLLYGQLMPGVEFPTWSEALVEPLYSDLDAELEVWQVLGSEALANIEADSE